MKGMKLIVASFISLGVALGAATSSYAEEYNMVGIPKLRSAWFNDFEAGLQRAGKDFGVATYFQAPAAADEQQQVNIIRDSVSQGNNAILVVPNNANSVVPVFKDAREKGIVVITHESAGQSDADFDVEMISDVKFGEYMMDRMAEHMGGKGEYAIYVGSLTVPAHNVWADAAIARAKDKYPEMTLISERFPVSEDRNQARQKTLELMSTYPDIKGIIAFGSQGAPGAAQALREKGMIGALTVIGTTSPKEAGRFFEEGSMTEAVLWSPADAAYAMVYIAKTILDGNRDQIVQGFEIPTLGVPEINGINIIFDKPLRVDKSNYQNYDF